MDFIYQLLTNKIFLFASTMLVAVLVYMNIQKFKNTPSLDSDSSNKKEDQENEHEKIKNEKTTKVTRTSADENIALQKMQDFLNTLPDVPKDDSLKNTNKMLSQVFEDEMSFNPNLADTFNLKLIQDIDKGAENIISNKFTDSKGVFVNRIDSDGKIIIHYDSIIYITGKHEPLIMPDGSVRVLNLLKLEDEILLNIKHEKPIFCFDEDKQNITKLTDDQIAKMLVTTDEVTSKETLIALKEQNMSLLTSNDDKNVTLQDKDDEIEKLKENIKELQIELKVFKDNFNTMPNNFTQVKNNQKKEISQKNTNEIVEKKQEKVKEKKQENTNETIVEDKKDLENSLTPKTKDDEKIETDKTKDELLNDINSKFDDANYEDSNYEESIVADNKTNNNQEEVSKAQMHTTKLVAAEVKNEAKDDEEKTLKKVNGRTIPKIKKDFLNEFNLLSNENMAIGNKGLSELIFISMKDMKNNEFTLHFKESELIKVLKNYLTDNDYSLDIDIIELLQKIGFGTAKNLYFFNNKNLKEIYKTNICNLTMQKEKLFGMSVKSKYSNCFTLEELNKEKDRAVIAAKKALLATVISSITDYKFSEV